MQDVGCRVHKENVMICKVAAFSLISMFSLLCGRAAHADTLLYYDLNGPVSVTFYLPETPVVDPDNADIGFGFSLTPIDLMLNGMASTDFLTFYNDSLGGGFAAFSSDINTDVSLTGPQLYSGSEDSPTMQLPESQPLVLSDFNNTDISYSLTVTTVTPEPTGFLLLVVGSTLLLTLWKFRI